MRFARLGTVAAALLALSAGCDTARTLESESETGLGSCNRCHGFPPAAPHPAVAAQEATCSVCHSSTVDANGRIIAGGAHQNGNVEATAAHPAGYASPAVHGPQALSFLSGTVALDCTICHGSDFGGGTSGRSCNACHASAAGASTSWRENCTFCHGNQQQNYAASANPVEAAPPESVIGETEPSDHGVGAHQKHLRAGKYSNGFPCASCHAVPGDLGHLDGEAEVSPRGPAGQAGAYDHATHSCSVYCHGPSAGATSASPAWMTPGELACNACHGLPPNDSGTGFHRLEDHRDAPCASCHEGYVSGTTVDLALHVDGARNLVFPPRGGGEPTRLTNTGWQPCSKCHGAGGNANAPVLPIP